MRWFHHITPTYRNHETPYFKACLICIERHLSSGLLQMPWCPIGVRLSAITKGISVLYIKCDFAGALFVSRNEHIELQPLYYAQQGRKVGNPLVVLLTHWGRVTHICVSKLTIIGSDNGLSPGRRQAIIWTNAGILLIGPLGTNFSEILIAIEIFSFKNIHLKISSGKWRPFCLGFNELMVHSSPVGHAVCQCPLQTISQAAWNRNDYRNPRPRYLYQPRK